MDLLRSDSDFSEIFDYFCHYQTPTIMRYSYRSIFLADILIASVLCGCTSKNQADRASGEDGNESEEWVASEDFTLPTGMTAEKASSFPGLTWNIDTLHGICAPDTLLLWANYADSQYLTNVNGISGHPLKNLKLSGNEKVEDGDWMMLEAVDFKPTAMLIDNPYGSLAKMRETKANDYLRKTGDIVEMVRDFFVSGGSSEYMRRSLATLWERECEEAKEYYDETLNPFNNGYRASFAADKINVIVADGPKGLVEVQAYATDPYTLGIPGWTYWTVEICRESNGYKIKELPAIHRKFGDIE